MKPALVILAAGLGSRYGGLKQVDPVGPNGEIVLDYSVYDARRAGFGKVIFVIREELAPTFRERFSACQAEQFTVEFAFQKVEDIPPGVKTTAERTKPWGTGHAVLAARNLIKEPFAVINADDFYGPESYRLLARFLAKPQPENQVEDYAMVGFELQNTLSPHGTVARGLCTVDDQGVLVSIEEHTEIRKCPDGVIRGRDARGQEKTLAPDSLTSMNMWGFTPSFPAQLEKLFKDFLKDRGQEEKSEFYLPAAVDALINRQKCRVKVTASPEEWFGVTYREDREAVVERLKQRIESGLYPRHIL